MIAIKIAVIILVLSLMGGAITATATFIVWWLLTFAFWVPFFRELREMGMYTHDIGAAHVLGFGVPAVGVLFFLASALSLSLWSLTSRGAITKFAIFALNAVPSIAVFILLQFLWHDNRQFRLWYYPFAEISVLAIGIVWSVLLMRRVAAYLPSEVQPR